MTSGRRGVGWLIDASVALKWFMPHDEPDVDLANEVIGNVSMRTTTLAQYEVANILITRSGMNAEAITRCMALLDEICGEPIALTEGDRVKATQLAIDHRLTFYDASYAAIAIRSGRLLVSADGDLTGPGLARTLKQAVEAIDRGLARGDAERRQAGRRLLEAAEMPVPAPAGLREELEDLRARRG